MTITVHVYHHFGPPADIKRLEKLMSALSDKIAADHAAADAAIARVQADLTALRASVADLTAKAADGTATPEDLAALDALKVKLDALDPAVAATLPPTT